MRSKSPSVGIALVVVAALFTFGSYSLAADVSAAKGAAEKSSIAATMQSFPGITLPNKRSQHSLKVAGVISDIKVKRGDHVKKGDELILLDDREEQKNLLYLEVEAKSENTIRTAEKIAEARKIEYERIKELFDKKVESEQNVTKAQLDWDVAVLDITKATDEHRQKIYAYERQKELLNSMKVTANFDGIVQDLSVELGEVIDPNRQAGAIVIVNNDPLLVEVYIPSEVSLTMKEGQVLDIQDPHGRAVGKGKVIFLDPVVDASADRQRVRLEMANPSGKPAGLQVEVIVPPMAAAAANP